MAQVLPPFGVDLSQNELATASFGDYFYGLAGGSPVVVSASGAINPHVPATIMIADSGVAALTLTAPTAGAPGDDFKVLRFISTTAYAHTLTATSLLATGTASVSVATFAAHPGAGLTLMAYQGLWYVLSSVGITFS